MNFTISKSIRTELVISASSFHLIWIRWTVDYGDFNPPSKNLKVEPVSHGGFVPFNQEHWPECDRAAEKQKPS